MSLGQEEEVECIKGNNYYYKIEPLTDSCVIYPIKVFPCHAELFPYASRPKYLLNVPLRAPTLETPSAINQCSSFSQVNPTS